MGKLTAEPEPQKADGSLLGGCTYATKDVMGIVQARPANEFDRTVKASGDGPAVAGLGEKAINTKNAGLLVKLAGKDYFLGVMVMTMGGKPDPAASEKLAKPIVTGAK